MKKLYYVLVILLSISALSSCDKPGCTDPLGVNFDPDANRNDLSCTYNGSVTFWCEKATSDSLISWGNPMLYFEIDGELIDSIATASFFSTSGGCNSGGTKTIARDFSGNTKRTFHYRIKGVTYGTIWSDYVQIRANDCTSDNLPMP